MGISGGIALILMFFFLPETFWERKIPQFPAANTSKNATVEVLEPRQPSTEEEDPMSSELQSPTGSEKTSESKDQWICDDGKELTTKIEDKELAVSLNSNERWVDNNNNKEKTISMEDEDTGVAQKLDEKHIKDQGCLQGKSARSSQENSRTSIIHANVTDIEKGTVVFEENHELMAYTNRWRMAPQKTYAQSLRLYSGRMSYDSWFIIAVRPFVLFTYPAVLWSAMVYSLSIGWLIVLSESVSEIYRSRHTYNFTSFQTGLVYIAPFIGAVLGTAIAGKLSDQIVKVMAKRNGGMYEPEFRLVMALPIAITTAIGLMGFGWSVDQKDSWIVPTVFFAIISFGCSLGSSTAITYCVDSYKQFAGEALVTLNFSKSKSSNALYFKVSQGISLMQFADIFHGFAFSLFFPHWLSSKGSKRVFIVLGVIQLICMLFSIPMYIFGKRARMWTVKRSFVERIGRPKSN
jgi:hypothetical protein